MKLQRALDTLGQHETSIRGAFDAIGLGQTTCISSMREALRFLVRGPGGR